MGRISELALHSMQLDMKRVERIGVNVANALTPGYKREILVEKPFGQMLEAGVSGQFAQSGSMVNEFAQLTDARAGTLKPTGEKLDVAISSEGYFEVKTQSGLAYTRQGNFQIDGQGKLVTANGDAVMGKGGEIVLNSRYPLIDASGSIFDVGSDGSQTLLAQIKIVQFDQTKPWKKDHHGLVVVDADAELNEVKKPSLMQGHLENSNVNSMDEMVQLMQTMRHFESVQKMVQGYDDMLGTAIKKLGETS